MPNSGAHADAVIAPAVESLADRVAHWARRMPEDTAISHGATAITWRELDARASALARLVARYIPAGHARVALLFDNRVEAIVAILAIARSANAAIVLDAADPAERLRFILADAEPAVLVAEPGLADAARALATSGCVVLASDEPAVPEDRALPPVGADTIGYIHYTSGSTGEAKGVLQTHASQLRVADAYAADVGIGPGDRQAMPYPLTFIAGPGIVARTFAAGATVCLYDLRRDGIGGFADWLDRERVTMLNTFPAVLREMTAAMAPGRKLAHLRVLQLGGDSVYAEDFERFRAHTLPHCKFVHQLSSSELPSIARTILGHDARPAPGSVIPVGRAARGVRIEIRRDDGSAAAPGEVGEIVVCGRNVSPGYWKRPALTARAFGPDPRDPQGVAYRTGDLGRVDDDGILHFTGRAATRVKIRGHTVDLAEVDAALVAWPAAAHAAASAEADPGDAASRRLVVHVEARAGARRDARALMRFLATRLPRHMLPAEIRFLPAMPQTSSGKLDRKRLAEQPTLPAEAGEYAKPRGALEAAVAHVFGDLLKTDAIARDDDFFLMGGDSMMAADLQARLDEAFGVRVADLHADATVAGIAASVRAALADGAGHA